MIPMMNIVAWSSVVPWVDMRQVEQDLIISRAIVDIFSSLVDGSPAGSRIAWCDRLCEK